MSAKGKKRCFAENASARTTSRNTKGTTLGRLEGATEKRDVRQRRSCTTTRQGNRNSGGWQRPMPVVSTVVGCSGKNRTFMGATTCATAALNLRISSSRWERLISAQLANGAFDRPIASAESSLGD